MSVRVSIHHSECACIPSILLRSSCEFFCLCFFLIACMMAYPADMYICFCVSLSLCLNIYVVRSLYVCLYVCMYVCTYVCLYICMYARTYVCMSVCMYVCMSVCLSVAEEQRGDCININVESADSEYSTLYLSPFHVNQK